LPDFTSLLKERKLSLGRFPVLLEPKQFEQVVNDHLDPLQQIFPLKHLPHTSNQPIIINYNYIFDIAYSVSVGHSKEQLRSFYHSLSPAYQPTVSDEFS
jgi:hypothetical protein